jgi:hypothetical protein
LLLANICFSLSFIKPNMYSICARVEFGNVSSGLWMQMLRLLMLRHATVGELHCGMIWCPARQAGSLQHGVGSSMLLKA